MTRLSKTVARPNETVPRLSKPMARLNQLIKFFQVLETITKIASNGKHTFVIGDLGATSLTNRNGTANGGRDEWH